MSRCRCDICAENRNRAEASINDFDGAEGAEGAGEGGKSVCKGVPANCKGIWKVTGKRRIGLTALMVGGLCLVGWEYRSYKANKNYLINGDFEAQSIPGGAEVWTNHVVGWDVKGLVCLVRQGTNTVLAIPPSAEISQTVQQTVGTCYAMHYRVSLRSRKGTTPWRVRRDENQAREPENRLTIAGRSNAMVFVDDFKRRRIADRVQVGSFGWWEEYFYNARGGLSGREHVVNAAATEAKNGE
jgi:hypothetical protein